MGWKINTGVSGMSKIKAIKIKNWKDYLEEELEDIIATMKYVNEYGSGE